MDEFGNQEDAIKAAATLANLKVAGHPEGQDNRQPSSGSGPDLQSWLPAGFGKALVEVNRVWIR
nr:hypothetical protein [Aeromonas salmonicida]